MASNVERNLESPETLGGGGWTRLELLLLYQRESPPPGLLTAAGGRGYIRETREGNGGRCWGSGAFGIPCSSPSPFRLSRNCGWCKQRSVYFHQKDLTVMVSKGPKKGRGCSQSEKGGWRVGNKQRRGERNPFRAEAFIFSPGQAEKGCESCVHNFLAAKETSRPVWPIGGGDVWAFGISTTSFFSWSAGGTWDVGGSAALELPSFIHCESRGRGRIIGKDSRGCLACSRAPNWRAVLVFSLDSSLTCPLYSLPPIPRLPAGSPALFS